MDKYIPKVGDSVVARRKVKSNMCHNTVIGPVVATLENACRIVTNKGTEIEGDFQLLYSDWDFDYLFSSNEVLKECPINEMSHRIEGIKP